MKFKVGDKVRVKKSVGGYSNYHVGCIGTVFAIVARSNYPYSVNFGFRDKNYFKASELEKVEE